MPNGRPLKDVLTAQAQTVGVFEQTLPLSVPAISQGLANLARNAPNIRLPGTSGAGIRTPLGRIPGLPTRVPSLQALLQPRAPTRDVPPAPRRFPTTYARTGMSS